MTTLKTVEERAVELNSKRLPASGAIHPREIRDAFIEDRADILRVLLEEIKSIATTKETGTSDFPDQHVWNVDYHELVDLLTTTLTDNK